MTIDNSNGNGDGSSLDLVQTIRLRGPSGKVDHMALDAGRAILFVANNPNGSLDIVDLSSGYLKRQIPDQVGIQGIAYAPDPDRIFVGNGGGTCNVFDGNDYRLLKSIPLPAADNVRYHAGPQRVYVAYDDKALSILDASSLEIIGDVQLPGGSTRAFQVETVRPRLYMNAPPPNHIFVIDTVEEQIVGQYALNHAALNSSLAIDEDGRRLFVGCREPVDDPQLVVLDSDSGREVASVAIPGDVDDIFFDPRSARIYVSCGEGFIILIQQVDPDRYELQAKITTTADARTSLYDPRTARLYLAVPRQPDQEGPEIWVFQAHLKTKIQP
jgi:DNA-binding beta-propeller fold protein YncE